ncbi:MAG: PilZ domain-containing protein [Planctomycetota bacterium]
MDAEKIVKMTPESINAMVESQQVQAVAKQPPGRRRESRWPFPGTVELWLPQECYGERHVLATLHNLSHHGLAMRTRRPIPKDTRVSLAIHLPELSCYGYGVIRHCTRAHVGYLVGVEFVFESEEDDAET